MSSNVSVQVANNQSGKNVDGNVPVNGKSQTIGAIYSGGFGGQVLATTIFVQSPGTATGVNIVVTPPGKPNQTVNSNGTPLNVSNNGQPVDITNWNIAAAKQ